MGYVFHVRYRLINHVLSIVTPMIVLDFLMFYLLLQPSKSLLEEHYADLSKKPFFPDLIQYMISGPVVPMVTLIIILYIH